MNNTSRRTFEFGNESITGEELWRADFSAPEEFLCTTDEGEFDFENDSLHIDITGHGGAYCWYPHEFPEDVIIEYHASVSEFQQRAGPGDEDFNGRNLNCLFATTGPEGDPSAVGDAYRTDEYIGASESDKSYRDLLNYFLTVTFRHTRMRKSPGGNLKSELLMGVGYPDHTYEITILKRGDRIAAAVDGKLLHDWTDPDPLGSGWIGLVTWSTDVTYDRWAVYEPV